MSNKFVVTVDKDFEEIVPMFIDNRHKDLELIKTYLEEENMTSIEVIAHKLAGNAGSYGFMDLSIVGADMEKACKSSDTEAVISCFERYKLYMENLVVEYA